MHAMRQSMRPKHQVLVLKCYPKFQKGAADVLPNPSELSYLLYYASTRRSKIQKVADFLEKKSESDVSKLKVGNVQVTLHIIKALIEKSPRDLPLYAPHVLRIFSLILKSKNLAMIEESVLAFQELCEHEDPATLAANPSLSKQFEDVVRDYAALAQQPPTPAKTTMSAPVAIRWKTAGLQAIKSVTASEAVSTDRGRQLNIVIPVILENLYSDGEDRLVALNRKAEGEKETAIKRRMSIATTRTAESQADTKEAVMTDTAAESDRMAEEEAGLIAVQSLKQVFTANNRGQIRLATSALLKFLIEKTIPDRPDTALTSQSMRPGNWTTTLVEMVTKWTPVQDRFIILITTVENLVHSPVSEENIERQLILATLVEWLLSSTINMIGLSIMDVLLGLVQHVLTLLQRSDQITTALPHHEQTEAIDLFKPEDEPGNRSSVLDILNSRSFEEVRPASLAQQQLLSRLRKCVGSLATHIYYSDQVSDIVSALLFRLKPNPAETSDAAAVERPADAAPTDTKKDDPMKTEFFASGTARVTALNAIKDVITVANRKGTVIGAGLVGRNRVSARVWEGTQWLLRDEDKRVRRAYVEALLIWLRLEITKQDFRIRKETVSAKKRKTVDFGGAEKAASGVARSHSAVNPAARPRSNRSTFLQLLHLAIYENALEEPEMDGNILLLHLLLNNLVLRLGVNAVRTGLPMIRRLQEDINDSSLVPTPKAKVNVGSLVHGYLWTCYTVFDFETTAVGFEISREIARRKKHGLWLTPVAVPPQNLDMIIAAQNKGTSIPLERAQNESLRPFDHIKHFVEQIATAYDAHQLSPPSSPPSTPGRVLSAPKVSTPGPNAAMEELPPEFREAMNADWTKASCLAAAEKEAARSSSPTGSRSGTTRSQPPPPDGGLFAVNGHAARDAPLGGDFILRGTDDKGAPAKAAVDRLRRRSSPHNSSPGTPITASSEHAGTLRVDDLKRALAGGAMADVFSNRPRSSAARTASPLRHANTATHDFGTSGARNHRPSHGPSVLSNASESMVSAEGYDSNSEYGEVPPPPVADGSVPLSHVPIDEVPEYAPPAAKESPPSPLDAASFDDSHRPDASSGSNYDPSRYLRAGGRPRSSSDVSAEDPEANWRALAGQLVPDVVRGSIVADEGVPPVPPLPQNIVGHSTSRASNRTRGEALAPGIPYSGVSSGRSSAAQKQPSLGPLTTGPEDAAAAAAAAVGSSSRVTASPPPTTTSPALVPADFLTLPARTTTTTAAPSKPPTQSSSGAVTTGLSNDRPESMVAVASANAAGAAAAMEMITRAGGGAAAIGATLAPESIAEDVASSETSTAGANSRSGSMRRSNRSSAQHHPGAGGERHHQRDNKMLVQALLGSIEVGDVAGGRSIGKPPV